MSNTFKEFLKLFAPLALAICLVASWFLHTRNANHLEIVGQRQKTLVALGSRIITRDITTHASDARYLARLVSRRLGPAIDTAALREIEDDFADFAKSRQLYYMLRFIDETGKERIRLDRSFAGPVITPESAMQDKSDRYYFREAILAGKNDVYVSRFDLNIEHGRIEQPLRPTLRYACPVVDATGRKRGIIAINFNGAALLDQIEFQAASGKGIPMLTTGDGFWILGAAPEDEWGHILDGAKDATMGKRFSEAWKQIAHNDKGQVLTAHGLFTFDTIGIIPGDIISGMPPSPEDARSRWKIITRVPPAQLTVPWMPLFIALVVLFILIFSTGCWYLADYRIRQAEVESKLRESEERTLAISQSSQDAIAMVNAQDIITYWNPSAEKLLGYTAEEALGRKLHAMLAPEELRERANAAFEHFGLTGKGDSVGKVLEFDALHKDGYSIPVELAVSSFRLKGQWYAVGSMRDITRRKRDEAELIRSNETREALINAPIESAFLIEPDGTIEAVNKIAAERLGAPLRNIVGENIYKLIPSDLAQTRREMVGKVLETGKPVQFEDNRGDRRFLNNIYPSKNAEGTVDRIAIFARDVTEQYKAKQALLLSEQRFRDVSEAVGEFIWETDADGQIHFITEDVEAVLGYTPEDLMGRSPGSLIKEEDVEEFKRWRKGIFERRESFANVEFRNVTHDGRIVWLQANGVPYYDEQGVFMGYRGAAMDITDRKETEEAIKASERKLRALAESAYDAIIMIDTNGLVSFWNHAARQLFGYKEKEVMGKEVHSLIAPPEMRDQAENGMYEFAMTGSGPVVGKIEETTGVRKDGTTVEIERSVSGFRLGNEWYAVATIRDIAERKETEATLRRLATTDSLTGLNNRRRFMELAEREFARSIRYNRPLSMFMLDIDFFKKINDTHGHDAGDDVLRSLSEIIIIALRNADIVGRLGGEEFGVLLPETGEDAAMDVAERLRMSVERAGITTNAGELKITISVGVACLDPETKSVETLLKRADVALYDAKQSGRNRTVLG